jgi:ferredoxin-thioredoxin reductase catalytic subunit
MPAFTDYPVTNSYDYLRMKAEEYGCYVCFDGYHEEIMAMNAKGKDGVLYCVCRQNTPCKPCKKGIEEIEKDGKCYCEIFRRVK